MSKYKSTIWSISATIAGLLISFIFMGGGHGTFFPAKIIFPYSMYIALQHTEIDLLSIIVAFFQFSFYAILLDFSKVINKSSVIKFSIITIHIVSAIYVLTLQSNQF